MIIELFAPELEARRVTFRWRIDPAPELYRRQEFSFNFPETLDLDRIPLSLWWRIALICLHSHWPLFRPCQVKLPIRLLPGEAECWSRLLEVQAMTLEASYGTKNLSRRIEILEEGPELPIIPLPDSPRCVTAFSGGKDSLLQVGLLTELTPRTILVTTTSPMPPLEDHLTERRREVFDEIGRRRELTFVEVESDFRGNYDYYQPPSLEKYVPATTIHDTLLYLGSSLAAGYALGAPHLFLASEVEVNENREVDGQIIQHPHYMYSVVTQGAIERILAPFGIRYCSLTSPLRSYQVQELLWTRYRDISDLQYSCWQTRRGEKMCNTCSQCLRVALCALATGGRPSRMGVDWVKLLNSLHDWTPKPMARLTGETRPQEISSIHLHSQVARYLERLDWPVIGREIWRDSIWNLLRREAWRAIGSYRGLRRRAMATNPGPSPGYQPGFLRFVDPLIREELAAIYAASYQPAAGEEAFANADRAEKWIAWITEPLHRPEARELNRKEHS